MARAWASFEWGPFRSIHTEQGLEYKISCLPFLCFVLDEKAERGFVNLWAVSLGQRSGLRNGLLNQASPQHARQPLALACLQPHRTHPLRSRATPLSESVCVGDTSEGFGIFCPR